MSDRRPLRTPLCDLLGMRYPVVQPGMGWVATDVLAAAVAEAGAFPFIAAATLEPRELDRTVLRMRELTDAPFGVSFLMDRPDAPRIVDTIVRERVRAAGYSRSPDPRLIGRLKEHRVACVPTVGRRRHAERAVELGADAVIAQGAEGGGHTGATGTLSLVAEVVDAVDVPVVAAGGFVDGRGLVAALALGASGIAMGTRFLLTAESPVPGAAKRRYLAAATEDAIVSTRIDGMRHRMLRNELVAEIEAGRQSTDNPTELVRRGLVDGDGEHGVLPAGQAVGRIEGLPSCVRLVDDIVEQAERVVARLAS